MAGVGPSVRHASVGAGVLIAAAAAAVAAAAAAAYRRCPTGWLTRWLRLGHASCALDPLAAMMASCLGSLEIEQLQQQLCDEGFAVIDGVMGMGAVRTIREEIAQLDRAGRMRVGRVQHGAELSTNDDVRSDRIIFLSAGDEDSTGGGQDDTSASTPKSADASPLLRRYIWAIDRLRERLGASASLTQRMGGGLDGCTAMCAIYPGGGSRCVVRAGLPQLSGSQI